MKLSTQEKYKGLQLLKNIAKIGKWQTHWNVFDILQVSWEQEEREGK